MPTLSDVKKKSVAEALGLTEAAVANRSVGDVEFSFFSTNSGLTPVDRYTLADHKYAYYLLNTTGVVGRPSLRDLERLYYQQQGASGSSLSDLEFDLFSRIGLEFNAATIPGLALWLDSRKINDQIIAQDTFTRGKNLLSNPSFETDLTSWGASGSTITRSTAWAASGVASVRQTPTGAGIFDAVVFFSATRPTCLPGEAITISATSRAVTTAENVRLRLVWYTSGAGLISISSGPAVLNNTSGVRLTYTATAPANAASVRADMCIAVTTTAEHEWDAVQVERGSSATAFSWGDSTNLGVSDSGHVWGLLGSDIGLGISNGFAVSLSTVDNINVIDVGVQNMDITATGYLPSGGNFGIYARIAADNSGILWRINNNGLGLFSRSAGVSPTFTGISADALTGLKSPGTYTLRLVVRSNVAECYLDGSLITTQTITNTGTRVGLRTSLVATNRIDDFIVKTPAVTDGAPLSIWPDRSGNYRHAIQSDTTKQPLFRQAEGPKNLLTYNQATAETDTTGYFASGGSPGISLSRSTSLALHGTASFTLTAPVGGGNLWVPSGSVSVTPGRVFAATVAFRSATVARNTRLDLTFHPEGNSTGGILVNASSTVVSSTTTDWTTVTVIGVAPTGATHARIWPNVLNSGASEVHHFDNAGLFDVTPTWTPGGTGGNLLSADASSFETGTGGWGQGGGGGTMTRSTEQAFNGTTSLKRTAPVSGASINADSQTIAVQAGKIYYLMAKILHPTGNTGTTEIRLLRSSDYSVIAASAVRPTASGWQDFTALGTSSFTGNSYLNWLGASFGSEQSHYLDQVGLYEITVPAWVPPVTIPNSKPVVQFDGKDDGLLTPANSGGLLDTYTTYIVGTFQTIVGNEQFIFGDRAGSTPIRGQVYIVSGGTSVGTAVRDDVNTLANISGLPIPFGTLTRVLTARRTGSIVGLRQDGGAESIATSSPAMGATSTANRLSVGFRTDNGSLPLRGDVAAVLVYEGAHDDATRKRIEQALGRIYGITVAA